MMQANQLANMDLTMGICPNVAPVCATSRS